MDFNLVVKSMSQDAYQKLADAVATGRWADGHPMTESQREQSMQLVLAYQALVLKSEEPFTIGQDGQMVIKTKNEIKAQFSAGTAIARFNHNDI